MVSRSFKESQRSFVVGSARKKEGADACRCLNTESVKCDSGYSRPSRLRWYEAEPPLEPIFYGWKILVVLAGAVIGILVLEGLLEHGWQGTNGGHK
jgi:hypothetical protein